MANPAEGIEGVRKQRITEGVLSATQTAGNLEVGNSEYIELTNNGSSAVYIRCDGTTPTSSNGQKIVADKDLFIPLGKIDDVKYVCATGETATVFYRLYT